MIDLIKAIPKKKIWILFLVFVVGVLFRLWLISLVPQRFILDQREYHHFAEKILEDKHHLYAYGYRLYGYPLLLALIYKFFGVGDVFIWKIVQALLDASCGLMIYYLGSHLSANKKAALIGFILYMFNPFTSGYIGVRLTEISAIFLVTLAFFLLYRFLIKRSLLLSFLIALVLGFIPAVRPGFLSFCLILFLFIVTYISQLIFSIKKKIVYVMVSSFIFFLPFVYTIVGNYTYFHTFSISTFDSVFTREFYISLFIDSQDKVKVFPPQVNQIYYDYSSVGDPLARKEMEKRYQQMALARVRSEPDAFILSRIAKLWYVWEKNAIFPYNNPGGEMFKKAVCWTNVVLLGLGFLGFIYWSIAEIKGDRNRKFFQFIFLLFIAYISIIHAFTITANRFSLPAYPLIIMFAGLGIWYMMKRLVRLSKML